jgi:hypothetical protein
MLLVEMQRGMPERSFCFAELPALIRFEQSVVEELERAGWALVDFSPERRSGFERRRASRAAPDRRRPFWRRPV